jgi:GntR family transcriptional regulator
VRALAAEFKIHPNTAHKVVQHLIQEGWLEVRPGIGTVVAEIPEPRPGERKRRLRLRLASENTAPPLVRAYGRRARSASIVRITRIFSCPSKLWGCRTIRS